MGDSKQRVGWVDYAKGFCIVMVVMMHSVLGVEKAADQISWANAIVEFAKPFRMPDFFMISGLFLARVIDRDWNTYLDRKVVHFAYFYALWVTINFVFRGPGMLLDGGVSGLFTEYFLAFIEPFGTMWFIYLLPIFFVVAKATRGLPWWTVWLAGAVLQMAPVHTGWTVPDEFCARFVYFYSGYVFATKIFALADTAMADWRKPAAYLGLWAFLNGFLVTQGWAALPGVSLALGFLGAIAVILFAGLLSRSDLMAPLRYAGRHSIVIYLAFVLFMGPARVILLKLGIVPDLGTVGLVVTAAGIFGSLALFWAVRKTALAFLFERPAFARIRPVPALAPAG